MIPALEDTVNQQMQRKARHFKSWRKMSSECYLFTIAGGLEDKYI